MQKIRLIVVGIMLSALLGCASNQTVIPDQQTTRSTLYERVLRLKTLGCDKLPALERELLVLLIKSLMPVYPTNGICNPQWINDVLLERIKRA